MKIKDIFVAVTSSGNFVEEAKKIAREQGTISSEVLEACLHVALSMIDKGAVV